MKLPRAILFDLDDTILVAFGPAQSQWQRTIAAFADRIGPIEATAIAGAIQAASTELWADPARHKYWRHRIVDARRHIVATAFTALATAGHPVPPKAVGDSLAEAYNALHDAELSMFPDAHETLDRLKELGVKLALITNGAAEPQPKGLVPRRVPVCRHTYHRAVPEHVVLAVDQPQSMAKVKITAVETTARRGIGIHTGLPLAALD